MLKYAKVVYANCNGFSVFWIELFPPIADNGMMLREDTIFVSGLPATAGMNEIAQFFGQIGIIKVFLSCYVMLLLPQHCVIRKWNRNSCKENLT